MFDEHNEDGPLYIILQKSTNTRWQFHFESEQFMDEKDNGIDIVDFLKSHKKIYGIFKKLGLVDYKPNQWKIGDNYYNDNSNYHREDGPAIIWPDGTQYWFKDGLRHREDGPAVIWSDGRQEWWKDGIVHREDGPAYIYPNGIQKWYKDGNLHRDDGPAIIRPDGSQEWWIHGHRVKNIKEDVSINRLKTLAGIK
jgi:hypothetical protein